MINKFKPVALLENGKRLTLSGRLIRRTAKKGVCHDFELINNTGKSLNIARVRLFDLPLESVEVEVFRQGFFMPSDPTGFYMLRAGAPVPEHTRWGPVWLGKHDFISHSMTTVKCGKSASLMTFGFVSFERFDGMFVFNTRGADIRVSAWCNLENIRLDPDESCRLESVLFIKHRDFNQGSTAYADYVGTACNARVPRATITGWVDWQYYREEKNEKDIMRSVRAMQVLKRRGYPLKYVIIDGGWCDHASEWLKPCKKFPDIKELCAKIRRAGFVPGLWLAPYLTNVKTEVARRHPDWMVIDTNTGRPLFKEASNVGPCNVLDFSVPAVLNWLRRIVRIMVREWGVGYIKLDGPALAHYRGGRFSDAGVTTIEQVRRSLRVIREECGNGVVIEGEGVYGPAVGFVDTQRTTQDTNTAWHNLATGRPLLKENMKNDLLSAFLHGRLWHNHRENVVLRDFPSPFHAGVAKHPDSMDSVLTENQLVFQISAAALAGGSMLLSDPVEELARSPSRLAMISRFLPHYEACEPARPADVFQGGLAPSIYHLKIEREFETWYVVGVFNWRDAFANFKVPVKKIAGMGDWHAFDFWNEQYLGVCRDNLAVCDVPAHGCKVLALRRKLKHPQLIGTNIHILQGAVDLESVSFGGNTLRLTVKHFDQAERRLWFYSPPNMQVKNILTNAKNHLVDDRIRGLIMIQYNGRRRTDFEMKF